jgi:hypothetical protein
VQVRRAGSTSAPCLDDSEAEAALLIDSTFQSRGSICRIGFDDTTPPESLLHDNTLHPLTRIPSEFFVAVSGPPEAFYFILTSATKLKSEISEKAGLPARTFSAALLG